MALLALTKNWASIQGKITALKIKPSNTIDWKELDPSNNTLPHSHYKSGVFVTFSSNIANLNNPYESIEIVKFLFYYYRKNKLIE